MGFWGLALEQMPHRLRVDGRELRAWCAWDTLFLPEGSEFDSLWALARSLPPNLPPDLADVARAVCLCDTNRQFDVGLDALLAGLDPDCNTR